MYGYIYKIINCINEKVYIGQTTQPLAYRFTQHCCYAKKYINKNKTPLTNAINKYGRINFSIIEIDTADTKEELDIKEKFWIKKYNSVSPNGYNLAIGGGGCAGWHMSEEQKQAISKFQKGRVKSEIERQHISEAQKKVIHKKASYETKLKMSKTRTGHLTSDETRYKISIANKGKKRTKEAIKNSSTAQLGKKKMFNKTLKLWIIAMSNEFNILLQNGFIFEPIENCTFISKKNFKKQFKILS